LDLNDVLRAVRSKRRILVAGIVAGLAVAALMSWSAMRMYVSSTQLFVSVTSQTGTSDAYQGNLFSQQRVASYSEILTGTELAQQVVDDLQLPLTARQVAAKVSATPLPDTVVLDVLVTDTSAERAQAIAASLGRQFSERVTELETPDGATTSMVKVSTIQDADLNPYPVSPDILGNLWRGAAVGLVVGLGLALLRGRLDRSVRGDDDVQNGTGTGPIDKVPDDRRLIRRLFRWTGVRRFRPAEGYRGILARLRRPDGEPPRVVVVTSSVPGEGKSTVAVDLSVALARSGSQVMLLDCNLWRPRVARYLGVQEGGAGLTDVLSGSARMDEVARPWDDGTLDGNLTVLPAGPMPPNPEKALGSEELRVLLKSLRDTHEFVIIDAPALLPVADAAALSGLADGCLLVTRFGKTTREQLAEAAAGVAQARGTLLGVVLNRVPDAEAATRAQHRTYKADADRRSAAAPRPLVRRRAVWGRRRSTA